jgi:hypothetical protein
MSSAESKVLRAMKKGHVDLVAKLLGEPPTDMYSYGMQEGWRKRAYQWVADQRRPAAIYPIHCWSAGYGGPQSPMTWFRCKSCGRSTLGQPHELPKRDCMECLIYCLEFKGWEVADMATAFSSTLDAAEGMPEHRFSKVIHGPSV